MHKKAWSVRERIDDKTFIEICKSSKSMSEAAAKLGLHFNSFKKRALELDCYYPNQAGIGIRKNMPKILLDDIVYHGLHPQYQSYKLKKRLLKEGYKQNKCEKCGIDSWNGQSISVELHHINGNKTDHSLKNLLMLCPNCHSQTENFRSKNKLI